MKQLDLTKYGITGVKEIKAKLEKGEITVPATKEEFDATYGDIYTLD
jgi:basic membrane protein A